MDDQMKSWLERQMADWEELAPQTDRVRLTPVGLETPALGYIAQFDCRGLIRSYDGAVSEFETFWSASASARITSASAPIPCASCTCCRRRARGTQTSAARRSASGMSKPDAA